MRLRAGLAGLLLVVGTVAGGTACDDGPNDQLGSKPGRPGVDGEPEEAGAPRGDGGSQDAGEAGTDPCPAGWICPKTAIFTSRIGAWYSNIWRKPGSSAPPNEAFLWSQQRYKPTVGFYDSDDAAIVRTHVDQMRGAGIDFMILDGTNVYSSTLARDTELLVHTQLARPANTRIPIAFALGANLWASSAPEAEAVENHQTEVDTAVADFATKTTATYKYFPELNATAGTEAIGSLYFQWAGRPLVVVYNAYAPGGKGLGWSDPKLTVRRATGIVNPNDAIIQQYGENGWWGWVTEYPQLLTDDAVGVVPGADNEHRGCGACTYVLGREGGALFEREWLRAIKKNPRAIVVSSWNDFIDETAIEPASPVGDAPKYTDSYGDEVPDWYLQMTRGYANLRVGLIDGYVYRDEDAPQRYRVVSRKLVPEAAMPHKQPVIVVPAGTLRALGAT